MPLPPVGVCERERAAPRALRDGQRRSDPGSSGDRGRGRAGGRDGAQRVAGLVGHDQPVPALEAAERARRLLRPHGRDRLVHRLEHLPGPAAGDRRQRRVAAAGEEAGRQGLEVEDAEDELRRLGRGRGHAARDCRAVGADARRRRVERGRRREAGELVRRAEAVGVAGSALVGEDDRVAGGEPVRHVAVRDAESDVAACAAVHGDVEAIRVAGPVGDGCERLAVASLRADDDDRVVEGDARSGDRERERVAGVDDAVRRHRLDERRDRRRACRRSFYERRAGRKKSG